ncbi:Crp/Fnr family transcriptional regulator [Nocardia sp. CDC160]|uniref:Crp/Fnr family transcriptional regulator n=1 Tax=Nocardia sp. CDC160 TaxID=3112166 RepID=UPI002DC05847|nr:Crp/Fnr family transcriptional regulator [Nocardia sp. CDC160]MEC3916652.1 Crp/Fnr family transcriptional regulator [Nocardia sp. CDC160]
MERLCPRSREDLLRLGVQTPCEPGRVLMRQGEPGSMVYLLRSRDRRLSACVKITSDDGKLIAIRVSGDVIGELGALVPDSPRSNTATVCTATIAHRIPGVVFMAFLESHRDALLVLCRTLADRLAWSDQRRLDFAGCPVPIRLARLLVEFVESWGRRVDEGWEITVRLSYEELGNLIGAGSDAVGLAMREMRDRKAVCLYNRHVIVRDVECLRRFTEFDKNSTKDPRET